MDPFFIAGNQGVVFQPRLQFVQDHKGVDVAVFLVFDQAIADLILHVAGTDPFHPLPLGLFAQLFHVVLGKSGQRLAIVQLQFLKVRQVRLFRLFQTDQVFEITVKELISAERSSARSS